MIRGSRTLNLHPRICVIPCAPTFAHALCVPSRRSYFACSEGCVPSLCTLTLKLFRLLRVSRALSLYPHFEAFLHAPTVVYTQFVPSRWRYPVRSSVRSRSICTLSLELFRIFQGLRTLIWYSHFEAILHAPRVAFPVFVLSL